MKIMFKRIISSCTALLLVFSILPIEVVSANQETTFIEIVENSEYFENNKSNILSEGVENIADTEYGIRNTVVYEIKVDGATESNLIFIGDENYRILNVYKVNYYDDRLSVIDLNSQVVSTLNTARAPVKECLEQVCASQVLVVNIQTNPGCSAIVGASCSPNLIGFEIIYLLCKAGVAIGCRSAEIGYICTKQVDQFVACPL